jgi:hypothetical protein
VFGNEQGKVTTRDMVEDDDEKQQNFAQRQAQRKAADKLKAAIEARRQGMACMYSLSI